MKPTRTTIRIMESAFIVIPILAGIALAALHVFSPAKHPSARTTHRVSGSPAPVTAPVPTVVHTDSTDESGNPASGSGTSWTSVAPEAESVKRDPAFPTPEGSDDSDASVAVPVEPTPEGYWTPERMASPKPMPMP